MGQFRFLTAGESHGKGLVAISEGMVADLRLEERYITRELKRRQQGYGRGPRMKIEDDKVEIIAGVRYGLTTGSPIALFITNRDWQNWQEELSVWPVGKEAEPVTCPRPGHADLAGVTKYGLEDIRPIIERASARETAARVAVGAIARRFLEELGIDIHSYTVAIGEHRWEPKQRGRIDWREVEASPVRCGSARLERAMMAAIDQAKADGDTLGGVFEVITTGVPIGLGSHVSWDRRLDGRIARAIMSINAVKGVEIGAGFALAGLKGSQAHDVIEPTPHGETEGLPWRHATNRAGGIEGGMSNGEDIIVRAAVKPIATLASPLSSVELRTGKTTKAYYERSDICVVPAAGVIGEAMLAIVLADACLEKFGGDNLKETLVNYRNYLRDIP
ncbi:MAG: chorismate synthase [Dehalococcoidia bacterium]|nr:chorismate synthase [Dehalococcoidia bacterium]MDH4366875.1 chorismate synthase [Dehalococcoidia bacterium]